jgi:hypothetical protein
MIRSLLIAGLAWAWFGQAGALVLYQQPPVWAGNGTDVGNLWTSHSDATVTGFRTNDNFSLTSAGTINEATWFGIYLNLADGSDATPDTVSWVIRFQADNAGAPGAVLLSSTQTAAQVTTQAVGSGLFNGNPVTVYEFTAFFATGLDVAANTTYWFSPLSRAPDFSPFFTWIQGTGGDDASFQTQFLSGVVTNTFVREGDRAFSLSSVPEPATVFLVCAGLVAFASSRRRSGRLR